MAKSIVCGAILMAVMASLSAHGAFDVRDFGAKGDGVTDDTAAFQSAIDAVAAQGAGKIVVPYSSRGYRIAGPGREFVDGRPCRGQLVIPPGIGNIAFEGEMPCKLLYSYQVRPPEAVKGGFTPTRFGTMGMPNTCIFSDWTPPEERDPKARPWTILSTVEGTSCKGKFSMGQVSIANLEFRAHLDKEAMYPKGGCVNLQNASRAIVRDSQFCLDDNVGDTILGKSLQPNPCHTVGLMMSGDQNDNQVLNNVAVQGFRYGLVLGEHVVADYLYVHNCEEGIVFHDATHLSVVNHVVAQHNRVILSTTTTNLFGHGMEPCNVIVGSVNFESGHGLLPAVSRLVYGVSDPGNRLRGSLVWHQPWGDGKFPVNGAKNLKIVRFPESAAHEVNGAVDWAKLNAAAREQAKTPIREGVPGVRPFWNAHAKAFIHPPAFEFRETEGVDDYRFALTADSGDATLRTWTAAKPWTPIPSGIWDLLAPGYYTLKVENSGERRFYRAAVFHGPYPRRARSYREAAQNVYAAVFNMPQVQGWKTSDDPPEGYDLYCYPAKILGSMIRALCRHAKAKPQDAKAALAISRKMADWLVAHSQPSDAPLAHFPPTYWGDRRRVSVEYAGQNMLRYPAFVALAYCELAAATGDEKYRKAALSIARTYVRLQGGDGTWPLKVLERDGSPVRANRLVPDHAVLCMFDKAFAATGDAEFRDARERAFAYVLKGPAATWNWDGQFEDIDPRPPYENLQKGDAVDAALRLFELGRRAEACEIVDWCEDQFVVWSDPVHNMDWRNWKTPTALEQYEYYTPIDASMGDMICAFSAAYKATGDLLYLEKAKALADNITRNQREDGTIPTYFDSRKGSDWVNCMIRAAESLEMLSEIAVTP